MARLFETPPLQIEDYPADARHTSGKRTVPITEIIIHATVGGFYDSLDWLTTNINSQVSCHRLIDIDGTIWKLVPDDVIANHVGFSSIGKQKNLNPSSLGIELVNKNDGKQPYPLVQVRACALQTVEWWGAYGFLPVLSHARADTQGKTDPKGFDWDLYYRLCRDRMIQVLSTQALSTQLKKAHDAAWLTITEIEALMS